jgi:hypothetical protein
MFVWERMLHADKQKKLTYLRQELEKYEKKLAFKMKFYRGVIHESAASELKHAEVTVLQAMVYDLKIEINKLEKQ